MRIEASITTKRPIDETFAALSDWTKSNEWITGSQSVTKTSDGPIGVGTTWRTLGKGFGRTYDGTITVTEFEPDHTFAWAVDKPLKVTTSFTLTSVDSGTRVDQVSEGEIAGFLRLAQPVALPMMKRQLQHDLETFRDRMDANAL